MKTLQQNKSQYEDNLKHAINGNKKAFGEIYAYHLEEIQTYIYYRVFSRFDAEDLTETVFLKAWSALPTLNTKNMNFRAWLYRIAKNTIIDYFRTKKPVTQLSDDLTNDTKLSLEQHVFMKNDYELISHAIQQLDSKMQDVIICRFINGLSHSETALSLGLSENYVRVIQMRGINKIRQILEQDYES